MSQSDARRLLECATHVAGLEVKAINRELVPEIVHLKMLNVTFKDGRVASVLGSANFTEKGVPDSPSANCELSVLVELKSTTADPVRGIFTRLWEKGAEPLDPDDFASEPAASDAESHSPFTLTSFQERMLRDLGESFEQAKKPLGALVSLPTGAGKTVVATKFLITKVLTAPGKRALWLAPYIELLMQARATFARWKPFFRFRLQFPSEIELLQRYELQDYSLDFMTTHAAYKKGSSLKDKYSVVVVDEAHFGASFKNLMLPKIRKTLPSAFFVGLTGTPFRGNIAESRELADLYGKTHYISREAIADWTDLDGHHVLATPRPVPIATGFSISVDETSLAAEVVDLNESTLSKFDNPRRNATIAATWKHEVHGRTLAFAINVDHAHSLTREFARHHPKAKIQVMHTREIPRPLPIAVHPRQNGVFSAFERREIYERFREGNLDIVIAVNLYVMGVDFPGVQTLFMSRPTLSPVLYAQMLGRGLRGKAFGGLDEVKVIDFTDDHPDTHETLKKRFMTFAVEQTWDKELDRDMKNVERLVKRKVISKPSEAADILQGKRGVYATLDSKGEWVNREWRHVRDLGIRIREGIKNRSITYTDTVEYILEPDEHRAQEIAAALRMASLLELKGV
jgi:superfamily II DNA or RNA helicase